MRLRVLDTGLASARWNVALSAALLESVDESEAATLRFHSYPAACVIGRNQDVEVELDLPACAAARVEIARRSTGGGAVLMGPGVLAFDLVLPAQGRAAFEVSRRAGEALVAALVDLGLPAALATPSSIEIGGRKVSGSAGRLGRRAALHQATLILDLAEAPPLSLLRRRTEGGRPTADPAHRVTGLAQLRVLAEGEPRSTRCLLHHASGGPPLPVGDETQAAATRLFPRRERGTMRSMVDGARRNRWLIGGRPMIHHITDALAAAFALTPKPAEATAAELARAKILLAREFGRNTYVFANESTWEEAA